MSKGWTIGRKGFKEAIVEDEKKRLAKIDLGEKDFREIRELLWESELDSILARIGTTRRDIERKPKSAAWKVAAAARLKKPLLCENPLIAKNLYMGAYSTVSRLVGEMLSGKRKEASATFETLTSTKKG